MKTISFIKTKVALFLATSALVSTSAFAVPGVECTTGTSTTASCSTSNLSGPGAGNAYYYELAGYSLDGKNFSGNATMMLGSFVLHYRTISNVRAFYHTQAVYYHTLPIKGVMKKSAGSSPVKFKMVKLDAPGAPRPPARR